MDSESKYRLTDKLFEKLSSLLFYFFLFVFIVALAFPHNPAGNWYQQFLPNIGGRSVTDVFFLDSLTGWAVTNATNQNPDTIFVLKTTNSGDNWTIQYKKVQTGGGNSGYFKIYFLNQNTGYVCDVKGVDKTTNGGANWAPLNVPLITAYTDMSILNTDTIWLVTPDSFGGGVFFTSNGGASWENQLFLGNQNPNHIYMFNGRIGFVCEDNNYLRKTTNSGLNWDAISGASGFRDIFFVDSLNGWKAFDSVRMTTNGGINWQTQILPYGIYNGGFLNYSFISQFSNLNKDTIWGVGGRIAYPNTQLRGLIYRTTNGGNNWLFQLPDTSINIGLYNRIKFINKSIGWAYIQNGIHTTTGGDPIWYTPVNQISSEIPKEFKLEQNFPNPFNPKSNIKYQISKNSVNIKIIVFDIIGKEIAVLVNEKHTAGTYQTEWNASGYSSGVYFYSLIIDGITVDTKKMILLK